MSQSEHRTVTDKCHREVSQKTGTKESQRRATEVLQKSVTKSNREVSQKSQDVVTSIYISAAPAPILPTPHPPLAWTAHGFHTFQVSS